MAKLAIAVCLIAVVFLVGQSFSLTNTELYNSKVTKAQYYKRWQLVGCRYQCHNYTVNDFMKAALIDQKYHIVKSNCQTASNCMWHLLDDCPPCGPNEHFVPADNIMCGPPPVIPVKKSHSTTHSEVKKSHSTNSTGMPKLYWLYVLLQVIPVIYVSLQLTT